TGMHLDNQAVGSDCNRRPRNCPDQALLAGAMRRIGHDRQMRELFGKGDGSQIESVAHAGFERLDARSQSTTWSFPPESRYSAASSHSFTEAEGPRLSRMGFLIMASLRSN